MKPGEREAKEILEKKGIVFNEEYYDDNSKKSMPDFMYRDCLLYTSDAADD